MIYLGNSFSLQMLSFETTRITRELQVTRISGWQAGEMLRSQPFVSCYGHADSARFLARYFHMRIDVGRERISLGPKDRLIVASVQRSRMREIGYDRNHKPLFRFYLVRLKMGKGESES